MSSQQSSEKKHLNQELNQLDFASMSYKEQLEAKRKKLESLLAPFSDNALSVFESPDKHYRMRAEFRVWHDGADTYHIMFDQATKQKYRVDQLPAASLLINQAMTRVIEYIKTVPSLRLKLFQLDYLSSTTNELVISMLYHKTLDEEWTSAATLLQTHLSDIGEIKIIGRAKKQKEVIGGDFVNEAMTINNQRFTFKQIENSFTQPNAHINVEMIEWVIKHAQSQSDDLLELYCGAGNFSVPMSHYFRQVLATEISKTSVNAAQDNISENKVHNLTIARLSSEEFVEAYNKTRVFNRLANVDLSAYDFQTVLVDPPRAGLDEQTIALISRFTHIVYISCNPDTLVRDLTILNKTHAVEHRALFDQFPFTSHMESGVIMSKRDS